MSKSLRGLIEAIEKTRTKISEKEQERRRRERKAEEEKERFWKEERKHLDEKEGLAEEIFEWCEEFSDSEHFRKLVEIDSPKISLSLSGAPGALEIYTGGLGHKRGSSGGWSRLSLRRSGALIYQPMASTPPGGPIKKIKFSQPPELAENLTKDYLEDLHGHIRSGGVYEKLGEKLESLDP